MIKSKKKSIFGPLTKIFHKNLLRSVFSLLTSCTISEKNNDWILRKSKKSPFLGSFCPNLGIQEFSRKICLGQFLALIVSPLWTISEKTNNWILRKSLKSPFLGPFCTNLGKWEFSQKIGLWYFWAFMHPLCTRMSQFREKLVTNGRTDRRTALNS